MLEIIISHHQYWVSLICVSTPLIWIVNKSLAYDSGNTKLIIYETNIPNAVIIIMNVFFYLFVSIAVIFRITTIQFNIQLPLLWQFNIQFSISWLFIIIFYIFEIVAVRSLHLVCYYYWSIISSNIIYCQSVVISLVQQHARFMNGFAILWTFLYGVSYWSTFIILLYVLNACTLWCSTSAVYINARAGYMRCCGRSSVYL